MAFKARKKERLSQDMKKRVVLCQDLVQVKMKNFSPF
jgi:hypothetical protein